MEIETMRVKIHGQAISLMPATVEIQQSKFFDAMAIVFRRMRNLQMI